MKTVISIENHPPISFVTGVTKARTGPGHKPCGLATRPSHFPDHGRLRGMMLVRFAARKASPAINWL